MPTSKTLLSEIERDLLDGKPLSDLLRKCIILGGRAGSQDLREWARQELRGYKAEDDEIPTYRTVVGGIQVDAVVGNNLFPHQNLSAACLPDFVQEAGIDNTVPLPEGVGELEALAARSDDLQLQLPGSEVIGQFLDSGHPFQRTERIYWCIAPSAITGVLDEIRTTLTELITELLVSVPEDQEVPTAEQASGALNVAVHGERSQVVVNQQSTGGALAGAVLHPRPSGNGDEPAWWTFGRKVWAVAAGVVLAAGALAAVVLLFT